MPRYVRLPTVVEAVQLTDSIDLGDLGLAIATDWVIQDVTGALTKMADEDFVVCFTTASQSSALTGYDIANTFPVPAPEV